jgi:hypothetical protein
MHYRKANLLSDIFHKLAEHTKMAGGGGSRYFFISVLCSSTQQGQTKWMEKKLKTATTPGDVDPK